MNSKLYFAIACAGLISVLPLVLAQQAEQKLQPAPANAFMLAKLEHSKNVLEGLTTNNLELVARHAQSMSLLSQERRWRVLQTEEYLQRSIEFRRSVDAMTEAARKNNMDGATLAYLDVTLKCVECHKYLREIRHASVKPLQDPVATTEDDRTDAAEGAESKGGAR